MLISGVLLYRTFAIFETNDEFNVINGSVEDMGDATKELGPFYSIQYNYGSKTLIKISSHFANRSFFPNSRVPWFVRGGSLVDGSDSNISTFSTANGGMRDDVNFRVVLMP